MGVLNEPVQPVVSWIAFSADHFVNEPRKPDFLWLPKPGVCSKAKKHHLGGGRPTRGQLDGARENMALGMKQPDLGSTKIR